LATTRWLAEMSSITAAGATLLLAIANLGMPKLRRRWLLAGVVGALGGFSLGTELAGLAQLAGSHPFVSVISFNAGVVLAALAVAALVVAAMRLGFARVLGPPLGVVVVSAVLGHMAWHWMIDRGHEFGHALEHAGNAGLRTALLLSGLWLIPAVLLGVWAWVGLRRYDGAPTTSLLSGLLARSRSGNAARDG
ncbi:MAG TPA: hypothetical protein VE325_11935, partial [Burkholderiales bacterium]|nr:hypothetical protein [Burkholderiales bacterium]